MEQKSGPPHNHETPSSELTTPVSGETPPTGEREIPAAKAGPSPAERPVVDARPPAQASPNEPPEASKTPPPPVSPPAVSPSLDERNDRLDRELKESQRECEDLKSRLDVETARVDELTREHAAKNERLHVIEEEINKLRTRLNEVMQLENQWQAREEEWAGKVKALEEQRVKGETITAALQEQLAKTRAALETLRSDTESKQQAARKMQDEMGAAMGEKEKVALELEELRMTLKNKEDEFQVSLERECDLRAQAVKEERQKRGSLETEIEQARQEITSLQEQVRAAAEESKRADRLRVELAGQESEKAGLAEELSHHQDEIDRLKKKLEDQNSRFDKVRLIFKKKNKIIAETGELLNKRDAMVKEFREKLSKYEYWDKNNKFLLQTLQDQLDELSDAARILGIKKFVKMSARLRETLTQIEWE